MTEEFQIDIPATFMALYVPPGKIKPTLGQRELAARYELCEDLANLLTEKAANMQFTLGITEELVLAQCEAGLLAAPAVVTPGEARWVVCRLGELLQWPIDQLLQSPVTPSP
ncbi:MAG: ATPase with chaperone activity [Limnohabitans sp.]|nr:ATPase with chaperone activity [Limnohabitans sp.]